MANHVRTQIRDQVATYITGLTTTGSRVFKAREYPLQDAELPGLCIYTADEECEINTIGFPGHIERALELVIKGYAKATGDVDLSLDTMQKEIEAAIGASAITSSINSLAKSATLVSSHKEISVEGEKPVGMIEIIYSVRYVTRENAPDVAI